MLAVKLYGQQNPPVLNWRRQLMAIILVNLHQPAPSVKNWRILLVQSFTASMPLLTTTSKFG